MADDKRARRAKTQGTRVPPELPRAGGPRTRRVQQAHGGSVVMFRWQRRVPGRLTGQLRLLAQEALARLGHPRVEVGVLLCDDATIRTLSRRFRDRDAATDVLSFSIRFVPEVGPSYLGDVAISVETAARQAQEAGVKVASELAVLLLHGLVHLAGFDHETDSGEMAALESRLRRELVR